MRASITFAAGQSSEIGRCDVPCEESLPGLGMEMTKRGLPNRRYPARLERVVEKGGEVFGGFGS